MLNKEESTLLIVNNITTKPGEPEQAAIDKAIHQLRIPAELVNDAYVSKTSLDARKQEDMKFVHTVVLELRYGEEKTAQRYPDKVKYERKLSRHFD